MYYGKEMIVWAGRAKVGNLPANGTSGRRGPHLGQNPTPPGRACLTLRDLAPAPPTLPMTRLAGDARLQNGQNVQFPASSAQRPAHGMTNLEPASLPLCDRTAPSTWTCPSPLTSQLNLSSSIHPIYFRTSICHSPPNSLRQDSQAGTKRGAGDDAIAPYRIGSHRHHGIAALNTRIWSSPD